MAAKLTQTGTPGMYRRNAKDCAGARCDCSYVVVYDGKARTFATQADAREGKRIAQSEGKLSRAHARGLHPDEP